jgi:hypothetical protein
MLWCRIRIGWLMAAFDWVALGAFVGLVGLLGVALRVVDAEDAERERWWLARFRLGVVRRLRRSFAFVAGRLRGR